MTLILSDSSSESIPNNKSPTNSLWAVHAMLSKSCQNRRPGTRLFDITVAKMAGFHRLQIDPVDFCNAQIGSKQLVIAFVQRSDRGMVR
jgi:hypothetical protein